MRLRRWDKRAADSVDLVKMSIEVIPVSDLTGMTSEDSLLIEVVSDSESEVLSLSSSELESDDESEDESEPESDSESDSESELSSELLVSLPEELVASSSELVSSSVFTLFVGLLPKIDA
jgi:hypothetical protein